MQVALKLSLCCCLLLVSACAYRKTSVPEQKRVEFPTSQIPVSEPVQDPELPAKPRLGIILGPGGARTMAHIGFLREIEKSGLKVYMIAGIEWASMVAAIYAQKNKANDVEWQMSKLDPGMFSKKLLFSGTKKVEDLSAFLKASVENLRLEDAKTPFACPSMNVRDQRSTLLASGLVSDAMKYCLPYFPLLSPAGGWVAGMFDSKGLIEHFRKNGVEYVVLVDVVSESKPTLDDDLSPEQQVLWSQVLKEIQNTQNYYDKIVKVKTRSNLSSFNDRKINIQTGEASGRIFVSEFKDQFGF
jgi:NTE family protein